MASGSPSHSQAVEAAQSCLACGKREAQHAFRGVGRDHLVPCTFGSSQRGKGQMTVAESGVGAGLECVEPDG